MAKRENKNIEVEEIEAVTSALSPVYSNTVRVAANEDFVLLDFGFIAPSYCEPYKLQDKQIGRICLDWDTADDLLDNIKSVIAHRKREHQSKQKKESK